MRTSNQSSGIKGVTERKLGKYQYWVARIQGRLNISKLFPYSESGKIAAEKFYKQKVEENINKYYQYADRHRKNNLQ